MERGNKKTPKEDKGKEVKETKDDHEGPFKIVKHANENEWEKFQAFCVKTHKHHAKFIVSNKEGHPWADRIEGKDCYSLAGRNGGILYIIRGKTYHLSMSALSKKSIMLTTDPCGGKNAKPLVINGVVCPIIEPGSTVSFRVGGDFPNILFYQDTKEEFLGGAIVVQKPYKPRDRDCDEHEHTKF